MRKLMLIALVAASLGACQKTGEGEYQVQTPDVDVNVQRDSSTVQMPDVDVGTTRDSVTVPTVGTKRTEVTRPTVDVNQPNNKQP